MDKTGEQWKSILWQILKPALIAAIVAWLVLLGRGPSEPGLEVAGISHFSAVSSDLFYAEQATALTVTDGTAFSPTNTYQQITAAGTVTPTVSTTGFTTGHVLVLVNSGSNTINLADSGTAKLYINGTVDGTNFDYVYEDIAMPTYTIGVLPYGSPYKYYDGIIDEVKIYGRALSQTDASNLYNSGNQHTPSGDWTSELITDLRPGTFMGSTTIYHSWLGTGGYIERIEWLMDSVIKATYDTHITAGTSTTITQTMLAEGSFGSIKDDFYVKLYLRGGSTPVITGIEFENAIPEPASLLPFSLVLFGFIGARRRKKRRGPKKESWLPRTRTPPT